jgi:hypothetical protein
MMTPGGYLTLNSVPYQVGDVEAAILNYVPDRSASVPLVNGAGLVCDVPFCASPLSPGLSFDVSNLTPGNAYDVYAALDGSSVVLGMLPWSAPRGYAGGYAGGYTGGGSPALLDVPYYGIPVIPAAANLVLPGIGNTLSVAQYEATYLGSILISTDAAILRCHSSYGEAREWGVWNRHNQRHILLKGGDTTMVDPAQLYVYSPAWAPVFGDLNAYLQVFSGRPVSVDTRYSHSTWIGEPSYTQCVAQGAIGWNSQSNPSGFWWQKTREGFSAGGMVGGANTQTARFCQPVSCGMNKVWGLVKTQAVPPPPEPANGQNITMGPLELRMLLTAEWKG